MRARSKALLAVLAADPRARDRAALAALYDDIGALNAADFVELCASLRADARRGDSLSLRESPPRGAAYAAVDRTRRKLLVTARKLIPLLAERLRADASFDPEALSAQERRSLLRFVKAAAAKVGEAAVIDAADAILAERSLARDIL